LERQSLVVIYDRNMVIIQATFCFVPAVSDEEKVFITLTTEQKNQQQQKYVGTNPRFNRSVQHWRSIQGPDQTLLASGAKAAH